MKSRELQLLAANGRGSSAPCQSTAADSSKQDESLRAAKIMIVDDEPINVTVARKYLSLAGYEKFVMITDSRQVMTLLDAEQPDIMLLDIMMPHLSGLDILANLRADAVWEHLPVIVLTASTDQPTKRRALELRATDFLAKPVDPTELIPRIQNVLTVKRHHDHMQRYAEELEAEVLRRTAELARSRQEVIHCLARAAEFRDNETGRHVLRVGRFSRLIATELGWRREELDMLEQAAQLHDIGKIGIPDAILLKPGKLMPEEFEIMQKHSCFGHQIIGSLPTHDSNVLSSHSELGSLLLRPTESPILALAGVISLTHHEKWDGSGYPHGLAGENIPIEGRITAVADVFDALSSKRPYKPAFPLDKCLEILEEGRGKHFDPRVLDAFMACLRDVVRTQVEYADE
jgi:putative two-component system response regulator